MTKEHISEWFKAGLQEIGITEEQYQKAITKEKNEIKKILALFGHY